MPGFEIDYNKLRAFKNAFKQCKKCKSKIKKDSFDTCIIDKVAKEYKSFKGKTDIEIDTFKAFFENVIRHAEYWILDEDK